MESLLSKRVTSLHFVKNERRNCRTELITQVGSSIQFKIVSVALAAVEIDPLGKIKAQSETRSLNILRNYIKVLKSGA